MLVSLHSSAPVGMADGKDNTVGNCEASELGTLLGTSLGMSLGTTDGFDEGRPLNSLGWLDGKIEGCSLGGLDG